jgi:hypothetical protein
MAMAIFWFACDEKDVVAESSLLAGTCCPHCFIDFEPHIDKNLLAIVIVCGAVCKMDLISRSDQIFFKIGPAFSHSAPDIMMFIQRVIFRMPIWNKI